MNISPLALAEIRTAAAHVREAFSDDFDADTFRDTLEGETDAIEMIGSLLRSDAELDAMIDANKALAKVYADRARLLSDRKATMRGLLAKIMDAIGEKTLRHDLGTVTVRLGKPELIGDGVDGLPAMYTRVKIEPDRAQIRDALSDGIDVPGYTLGNAAPSLTIRRA